MRIETGIVLAVAASLAIAPHPAGAQEAEVFEPDQAAVKALDKVVQTYRKRPALRVKSTLRIELTQGETTSEGDEVEAEFLYLKGGDGLLRIRGFTCYINDGDLFAIHEDVDHSYFTEVLDGAPYWLLLDALRDLPYPHLAILWGDPEPEFLWWELHTATPEIVPVSVEEVEVAVEEDKPARKLRQITLKGSDGSMVLRVDPRSLLIQSVEHTVTGGEFIQEGAVQTTRYRFEYQTFEQPPDPKEYTFSRGDRQRVGLLATLIPPPDPAAGPVPAGPAEAGGSELIGKVAPPFTLATADGDAVDLEELRGQVVVLDFWATWCGPCRKALPGLHEVARWVDEQELPVKILTVNIWEKTGGEGAGQDERLKLVGQFWQSNKFTLPVAIDYTNETAVAYGISGIPTTVVIRSDGIVHTFHIGAATPEALRKQITDALEALESSGDRSQAESGAKPSGD
ncbi:MAG: TlpA family protein disulfide reductase [Phycisphaerales bacterium]|nr:MAG: TlpA family protein disulfide reductase [Phycisphaerales bacterium]